MEASMIAGGGLQAAAGHAGGSAGNGRGAMRWVAIALFASMWLLPAGAQAQVNALPSLPHLLVKGEASRDVVPDRFTVSVMLTAVELQPDAARERVQANLAALLEVVAGRDSGAIPESVDATVFSVAPEYVYEGQKRVFVGTKVTRQLRVTFGDPDRTRAFLAGLQASESVVVAGIEPTYSGAVALRGELKAEAMRQTRETADLLARSYGTRIRSLYSVSDVAPSFAYGIQAGQWPAARRVGGVPPAPVADVGANITVTGSRITPESIAVGTIAIAEHLYAVFLLAE